MSNSKQTHGSILTLGGGASRKRKEREIGIGIGIGGGNSGFDAFALKASKKATTPTMAPNRSHNYMINKAEPKLQYQQQQQQQPKTNEDNRLLAGFLAHEFLTKGTLLGQKWDPARAEAIPISPRRPNLRKAGAVAGGGAGTIKSTSLAELIKPAKKHESYAEVANLLKCDGVHIEGIVNPTQLARWFKM